MLTITFLVVVLTTAIISSENACVLLPSGAAGACVLLPYGAAGAYGPFPYGAVDALFSCQT